MLQSTFRKFLLNTSSATFLKQCSFASSPCKESIAPPKDDCPKFAVVLSGCGHLDGAEIHESVAVLSHLTRMKAEPHCFSYNCKQHHVIDHCKGEEDSSHCRNMMSESSRIARYPVKSLEKLREEIHCFDAVIFPGGFGVAKNFSDFNAKGSEMEVVPIVADVLKDFHEKKKPIGLICISPILAAKLFPGVRITLGLDVAEKWPFREAIYHAKKMGASVESKEVHQVCSDMNNLVFSNPAFMYEGEYHQIYDGIGNLIQTMLLHVNLLKKEKKNQKC